MTVSGQENIAENLSALQILQWHTDVGADEAVSDTPINAFELKPPVKPKQATLGSTQNAIEQPLATKTMDISAVTAPKPESKKDLIPQRMSSAPQGMILGMADAEIDAVKLAGDAKNLDELLTALNSFEGCPLSRTAMNTVFADGNPEAKIMLIGDAPGADEDRLGKSFAGNTGALLNKMLAAIGLDRTNVYMSNIVNWRPPGNRVPTDTEISVCLPFIKRHIELVNPDIVIMVGGVAAKTLLGTPHGIARARGKWVDYKSDGLEKTIQAMAMFHPDYLLKSPAKKAEAWKDLQSIAKKLS